MVALDKQFDHHHGTKPRSCGRLRDESWQTGKSAERRTAEILSARRPRDASISSTTSCANEIIYCGYRFDSESQLYYVRNRNYNPVLGRWIQRDPIGYDGGINLYEYAGDHPVAATDPKGKDPYGFGVPSDTAIGYNGYSPAAIERAVELEALHSINNFFRKLFVQSPVSAGLCAKVGPCKAAISAGAGSGLTGSISYSNGPISGGMAYHFQSGRITPTAGTVAGPAGLNQSGTLTFLIPTEAKGLYVTVGLNLPMECRAIAKNPPGYVTDVNGNLQVVPP